jgi:hypothetical protein
LGTKKQTSPAAAAGGLGQVDSAASRADREY